MLRDRPRPTEPHVWAFSTLASTVGPTYKTETTLPPPPRITWSQSTKHLLNITYVCTNSKAENRENANQADRQTRVLQLSNFRRSNDWIGYPSSHHDFLSKTSFPNPSIPTNCIIDQSIIPSSNVTNEPPSTYARCSVVLLIKRGDILLIYNLLYTVLHLLIYTILYYIFYL